MRNEVSLLFRIIRRIQLQLIILAIIAILKLLEVLNIISPIADLIPFLTKQFNEKGYLLVGICSFLENIAGFNAYFPGSIVILTAMGLTSGNPIKAILTFLCIYIPSTLAHFINYYAGTRLSNTVPSASFKSNKLWILFFSTMWHPNFAAITSIKVGSERMPFKIFLKYFFPTSFLWNIFWGTLMYTLGGVGSFGKSFPLIFICYLLIWMFVDIAHVIKKRSNNSTYL